MISKRVPLSFVTRIGTPTWTQAYYGMRQFWFSYDDVIDLAQDEVVEGEEREEVIEIAGLTHREHDQIWEPLEKLADEPTEEDRTFWYRVAVAWIWEKAHPEEVLFEISNVYGDFEQPEEIKPMVYYADFHEEGVTEETLLKRVEMYVENLLRR